LRDDQAAAEEAVRRAAAPALQAQRAHEQKAALVEELRAEADQLSSARQALIEASVGSVATQLKALQQEVQRATDALMAVDQARLTALDVRTKLSNAKGWSTYDTWFGGGLLSSAIKHERLDSVNDATGSLTAALNRLRAELEAIGAPTSYFSVQTNDLTATTDIWWDNIVSDLAMSKRIDSATNRIERLIEGLGRIAQTIGERRTQATAQIDQLIGQEPAGASG
jgi:hypothetical protein